MSKSDALLNLIVSLIIMTPFMALALWIIRDTPIKGRWQDNLYDYRIRIAAIAMLLMGAGLMIYFMLVWLF